MTHEPGTAARPARRALLVVLSLLLAAALALLVVRTLQRRDVEAPAGGGYGTTAERARIDEFEEQVKAVEAIVAQSKLQVKAKVNAVGVASVDGDRATAFVAWETSGRYGDGGYGDPRQTRSKVMLVRVKGEWRVDDFTPVTGE